MKTRTASVVPLPRQGERSDKAKLLFALLTILESTKDVGRLAAESYLRLCEKRR